MFDTKSWYDRTCDETEEDLTNWRPYRARASSDVEKAVYEWHTQFLRMCHFLEVAQKHFDEGLFDLQQKIRKNVPIHYVPNDTLRMRYMSVYSETTLHTLLTIKRTVVLLKTMDMVYLDIDKHLEKLKISHKREKIVAQFEELAKSKNKARRKIGQAYNSACYELQISYFRAVIVLLVGLSPEKFEELGLNPDDHNKPVLPEMNRQYPILLSHKRCIDWEYDQLAL
ncbi:hypothetical protein TetV_602 [Tetraselmis virus 1]|uniref:Uncharacterized protein n=1 Tax=Tetraselmis virus 1 TaxID=2060617 RepID=A0A2P0VP50_9VIRU|nr:hypothetical protein QJ968_gp452 [Tetraselmis virus 1]AUF82684.1 hypothetical protein TetV_602 [Tetraselmis virus 1]